MMDKILKAAVERGASDLHIKAGDVFRARIDGTLQPLTKQRLTPDQTKSIALRLIPTEQDRKRIDQIRDYDCSWGAPGVGRFRVNILRQRSSFMIVMRVIPFEVPTVEKLGLPDVVTTIAQAQRGLVVISGRAGSGKSSTLAAIINHINATSERHIVTLENPIEFLHRDLLGSVTQREVGVDTDGFAVGLLAALRQDPDVILVGELPDPAAIDAAIKAVETGRLVVTALHTPDLMSTVARMVAMFPADEREVARLRLADSLHAVLAQQLLPRVGNGGWCAALEVMVGTPPVRNLLRDRNRVGELHDYVAEQGAEHGMQVFEQHLALLTHSGSIAKEAALAAVGDQELFERAMDGLERSKADGSSPKPNDGGTSDSAGEVGDLNEVAS